MFDVSACDTTNGLVLAARDEFPCLAASLPLDQYPMVKRERSCAGFSSSSTSATA